MRHHVFNIGKPNTDKWWARNLQMGVITAGYDGMPNDRGDVILHDINIGDWVIAYANGHGFVGAGIAAGSDTYRLMADRDLPADFESTHRHSLNVTWLHFVTALSEAVTLEQAGRQAPRQTKEEIRDPAVAERLLLLLADRSPQGGLHFAEEAQDRSVYQEGAVQRVLVDRYERDPGARKNCIAHWGENCCVCDFNFKKQYGALGAGYIQVHHLTLISTSKQAHDVDPVADLRPVCSNCHDMLHRTNPPLGIEALRSVLAHEQDGSHRMEPTTPNDAARI